MKFQFLHKIIFLFLLVEAFFGAAIYAQKSKPADTKSLLQSGPMLGYSEMKEVMLWVQTNKAAEVYFTYIEAGNARATEKSTKKINTTEENAFTAKLIAEKVEPGKKYNYRLYINNKPITLLYETTFQTQALWQWRTDAPDFSFAMGSCLYINDSAYDRPGKPYGGSYKILTSMYEKHPDLMLWLGDNTYLREADWNSRSGILYRYTHTRSLKELQPLLASVHHYAMWDDHDFGPDDSDRGFRAKKYTKEAFDLFWCNPVTNAVKNEGNYTSFEWNDVQFFMLDDRYFRAPNNRQTGDKTMLGTVQIQWLIDQLVSSKATFKIIALGGQVLNPAKVKENYSNYGRERDSLFNLIQKENIKGVVFLSGDRHFTELTKMERAGTYPFYDFTISPLTSGIHKGADKEANTMRVEGTLVQQQNFAVGKLSGKGDDRTLTVTVYDIDRKELWNRSIAAKELK
ncbi:MAG: alkaline phosphatase family protein [Sphingobacteriales bacterium]|nr:MAG: alkaline phosphatase family protein [Sphingobacteriales bacterium]